VTASILLIDNDVEAIKEMQPALAREGYRVDHALPGRAAIRQVLIDEPDLVILGVTAREDGWRFCRRLLAFLDSPALLLLTTEDRLDRVKALDLGADDCMVQPVLIAELVARVRALLRREVSRGFRSRQSFFVDDDLVVDLTRREVRLNDEPLRLTSIEFKILSCLVRYAGEVVPYDRLLTQAWGPHQKGSRDSVKQYIHHLRQKLEPDPHQPRRIVTHWGEGYMLKRIAE